MTWLPTSSMTVSNEMGDWMTRSPNHLSFCHHFNDADEEKRGLASFKSWHLAAATIWYLWVEMVQGRTAYGLPEVRNIYIYESIVHRFFQSWTDCWILVVAVEHVQLLLHLHLFFIACLSFTDDTNRICSDKQATNKTQILQYFDWTPVIPTIYINLLFVDGELGWFLYSQ